MSYASPKTQKAARLDAEGNHDEAVILLTQAAEAGDLHARTQLGKRLLVGDRAPRMPKLGAMMVLESAQENDAEAVASMAVLQCLGIFQKKNWQDALNSLTHAARLGWKPARMQLVLLTPENLEGDLFEIVSTGNDSLWLQLAKSIDINSWFRIPAGTVLADSPMVVTFSDFIPEKCQQFLIEVAQNKLQPSFNPDPAYMRNYNAEVSTYALAQIGLAENDFLHFLLQERMSKACGIPMNHMEGMSVLNYQSGQEFSAHCDYFDPQSLPGRHEINEHGQRLITFLTYLNDDYEGGETVFTQLGISHKAKAGDALYFVNARQDGSVDPRTQHAGAPVVSGQKWVLSQYFRSRPLGFISGVQP
jgi:prolyl 4-hydroxylase